MIGALEFLSLSQQVIDILSGQPDGLAGLRNVRRPLTLPRLLKQNHQTPRYFDLDELRACELPAHRTYQHRGFHQPLPASPFTEVQRIISVVPKLVRGLCERLKEEVTVNRMAVLIADAKHLPQVA